MNKRKRLKGEPPRSDRSGVRSARRSMRAALNELDPAVGQWYLHRDKGETFRVVAVDGTTGVVDIQNFDGDVEELEMDAWRAMDIEPAEAPEDWTGPFDDIESDDLGYTETDMSAQDWRAPLESLRSPEEPWQDTRSDELEDEEEGRQAEPYKEEEENEATRKRRQ